jgi:hypothetical protein
MLNGADKMPATSGAFQNRAKIARFSPRSLDTPEPFQLAWLCLRRSGVTPVEHLPRFAHSRVPRRWSGLQLPSRTVRPVRNPKNDCKAGWTTALARPASGKAPRTGRVRQARCARSVAPNLPRFRSSERGRPSELRPRSQQPHSIRRVKMVWIGRILGINWLGMAVRKIGVSAPVVTCRDGIGTRGARHPPAIVCISRARVTCRNILR